MNKIKAILERRKAKAQSIKDAELRCEFRVVERSGALFLTHLGVAFLEIPAEKTASEVATMLNEARLSAITFERL